LDSDSEPSVLICSQREQARGLLLRVQEAMCESFGNGEEVIMQYVGKAVDVAATIIEAFQTGNLPKAMAPIFIRRKDGVPCRSWSWGNQLLCVIYGTSDARGKSFESGLE